MEVQPKAWQERTLDNLFILTGQIAHKQRGLSQPKTDYQIDKPGYDHKRRELGGNSGKHFGRLFGNYRIDSTEASGLDQHHGNQNQENSIHDNALEKVVIDNRLKSAQRGGNRQDNADNDNTGPIWKTKRSLE